MEKSCYKDFTIQKELGRGSFGVVYLVHQSVTKQPYVLKRINIGHLHPKFQQAALREVEILKKTSHPNIIKYYFSYIEDNTLSIITEYAEGGDLYKLLLKHRYKKTHFTESELWRILTELAGALKYLHQNNIIHRDIKCQNVFLSKNLTVKLGDLGASRYMNAEMQATRVGTPLYLAPEMIKQQLYDQKIDIWGLGCVMYTLAAKEPPFIGSNLITLGISIINRNPKSIPSMFSPRLNSIIMNMLDKDPENRPDCKSILKLLKNNEEGFHKPLPKLSNFDGEVESHKFLKIPRPKPMDPIASFNLPTKPHIRDSRPYLKLSHSDINSLKTTITDPKTTQSKFFKHFSKDSFVSLLKEAEKSNNETFFRPDTAFDLKCAPAVQRPTTAKPTLRTIIKSNTVIKITNAPVKASKLKITVSDLLHFHTARN